MKLATRIFHRAPRLWALAAITLIAIAGALLGASPQVSQLASGFPTHTDADLESLSYHRGDTAVLDLTEGRITAKVWTKGSDQKIFVVGDMIAAAETSGVLCESPVGLDVFHTLVLTFQAASQADLTLGGDAVTVEYRGISYSLGCRAAKK